MQKDKKPSTYKGCGKHKNRTRIEENSFAVWKFRRFSGKLAVLTRHLRPIRSQSEFADCSVMGSPSPLDRCWMLNDSPGALSLKPAVRAAVEWYWSDLQRAAAYVLRDESLAAEIMDDAIAHAVAYLADHPPKDQDDVNAVLSKFCRREVGRRRKRQSRLVFIDLSAAQLSSSDTPFSSTDAAVEAERILRDAPPEVRQAMMLRYGSSESWSEVAAVTGGRPAAIRMRCKRFLDRIRRRIGIVGAPQ